MLLKSKNFFQAFASCIYVKRKDDFGHKKVDFRYKICIVKTETHVYRHELPQHGQKAFHEIYPKTAFGIGHRIYDGNITKYKMAE